MKKIIILLLATGFCSIVNVTAQAPPIPQIVISPQLFQPLAGMEDMQKKLTDLRTNAAFVADLGSFQKFAAVIEQTRCSTMNLQNLIARLEARKSKFLNTCEFEVAFNTGIYGLSAISDFTNAILTKLSIDPGDRLKLTLETMKKFDSTQIKILDLNKELEKKLEEEILEEEINEQIDWCLMYLY